MPEKELSHIKSSEWTLVCPGTIYRLINISLSFGIGSHALCLILSMFMT